MCRLIRRATQNFPLVRDVRTRVRRLTCRIIVLSSDNFNPFPGPPEHLFLSPRAICTSISLCLSVGHISFHGIIRLLSRPASMRPIVSVASHINRHTRLLPAASAPGKAFYFCSRQTRSCLLIIRIVNKTVRRVH